MSVTPLFIFSLPRSGSTLLQRMLSESSDVATTSEPWLLLPLLSMKYSNGTYADYGYHLAQQGVSSFTKALDTDEAFNEELKALVLRLYDRASSEEATYFLDKTPRYHTLSSSILDLFPEARAIILWRSPLSIVASMMETWAGGAWNLYQYPLDLYSGLESLVKLKRQQRSNVLSITYEELALKPAAVRNKVGSFLNIELHDTENAPPVISGELGDPMQGQYDKISRVPLTKWKKTLNNPFRKWWMRRYLNWIGADRLSAMGYDLDILLNKLDEVPTTKEKLLSDLIRWIYGKAKHGLELGILSQKLSEYRQRGYLTDHR